METYIFIIMSYTYERKKETGKAMNLLESTSTYFSCNKCLQRGSNKLYHIINSENKLNIRISSLSFCNDVITGVEGGNIVP